MNPRPQRISLQLSALTCLLLIGAAALPAQTLTVVEPTSHVVSRPLRDIRGGHAPVHGPTEIPNHPLPLQANYRNGGSGGAGGGGGDTVTVTDPVAQTSFGPLIDASVGTTFEGMDVYDGGYIPSDNNIAVGPNDIVETVNAAYAVYNKSGGVRLGPNSLRSLWAGLGGSCAANNGGDPIVQYDRAADRWLITQLGSLSNPYSECIAVSTSEDPLGAYNLYEYSFGHSLNDYPKFGVWPTATNSAYLASYNLFAHGATFSGAEICAYDRDGMIAGASSPTALCYTGIAGGSYLPSDADGSTPPLDGTPGYFIDLYSTGSLGVYKLTPDFSPDKPTAMLSAFSTIPVTPFTQASSARQPGTSRRLDALSDRLMYRLAFRTFADHEAIVVNHSVAAGSGSGVRWYELRAPLSTSGNFSLFQEGTYAPDSDYRWMGSAAMDQSEHIALGYSVSSRTTYPSVRYTGRARNDAPGTMQSEGTIRGGTGSQTGYSRWGDYSSLRIDPSDDCTFWYVNEYVPTTSSYGWSTRIGSFKFSDCGQSANPSPDFSLSADPASLTLVQGDSGSSMVMVDSLDGFGGTVDLTVSGCPLDANCDLTPASVTGSGSSTLTVDTGTSSPGSYTLTIQGEASGQLMHDTTVNLTVNAPDPPAGDDFSISAPGSLTVQRKSKNSLTVSTTAVGGSSSIALSISGLPQKTSSSFSVNPVTAGNSSTLTISANPRATPGDYNVTITGTNGNSVHSTTFTLTVQ